MYKILFITLLLIQTSNSQQISFQYEADDKLKLKLYSPRSEKFKMSWLISIGAGKAISPEHFVLSPAVIWELHEHVNVAGGVDIYFPAEYHDADFSINLLPYYWLRAGIFNFRIGAGLAFWDGHILSYPSIRLDFEIFKRNFIGTEVKTLLPVPFPPENGPPFVPVIINYSLRF